MSLWNMVKITKAIGLGDNLKYLNLIADTFEIEQLCDKIIPKFERLHGPGYQALIMVDNS